MTDPQFTAVGLFDQTQGSFFEGDSYQEEDLSQASQGKASQTGRAQLVGTPLFSNNKLVGHFVDDYNILKAKCADCGKLYNCKTTLVRHCRQVHGVEGGYFCKLCGKMFGQKSHLSHHETKSCFYRTNVQQNVQQSQETQADISDTT